MILRNISYNTKRPICLRYNLFDVFRSFHITTHIYRHHRHFLKFNSICHFEDQSTNSSILYFKNSLQISPFLYKPNNLLSLTYILLGNSGISLIYRRNNSGPKTDPCGTLLVTFVQLEHSVPN